MLLPKIGQQRILSAGGLSRGNRTSEHRANPKHPPQLQGAVYQTIVDLVDGAAASQGDGTTLSSPPPPVDAWSFANLRRARERMVRIEERQEFQVWEHPRELNVPPKL